MELLVTTVLTISRAQARWAARPGTAQWRWRPSPPYGRPGRGGREPCCHWIIIYHILLNHWIIMWVV